jgi:hypothetical protein
MKKILIGGVVGGIIVYIWSALAWVAIPVHKSSLHSIPNEDVVINAMRSTMKDGGVYIFPGMPEGSDQAAATAWAQKYQQGPIGMIMYSPAGSNTMMPSQLIFGLIVDILAGILGAWFLSRSTAVASSYMARVSYFGMLGIFVALVTHITHLIWLGFPWDYTAAMIADSIIGWLLGGLGIGAIVKEPKLETA